MWCILFTAIILIFTIKYSFSKCVPTRVTIVEERALECNTSDETRTSLAEDGNSEFGPGIQTDFPGTPTRSEGMEENSVPRDGSKINAGLQFLQERMVTYS